MYLTPDEKRLKKQNYQRSLRGYWPRHPFMFQRQWHYIKDALKYWWRNQSCKRHGHKPVVVVFIEGLPYPPELNGSVECCYVGGGRSHMHAFCSHCWREYNMFIPGYLSHPDGYNSAVRAYVHEYFPTAVFLNVSDYKNIPVRDQAEKECRRIKKVLKKES